MRANILTLRDAVFITLTDLLDHLCPMLPGSLPSRSFSAALDICRSVEYLTADEHEAMGSFFVMFPVRMAWGRDMGAF